MTIKEIAARTGVSADTLRYYERMGIIPAVPRTSGGVRNYDENFVEWVAFIQTLKGAGMSLEAIADYINLAKLGEQTCSAKKYWRRRVMCCCKKLRLCRTWHAWPIIS